MPEQCATPAAAWFRGRARRGDGLAFRAAPQPAAPAEGMSPGRRSHGLGG